MTKKLPPYLHAVETPEDGVIDHAVRKLIGPEKWERARNTGRPGQPGVLMAARVEGFPDPQPGSVHGPPCDACGKKVWIGPATMKLGITFPAVVCLQCIAREVAAQTMN